MSLADIAADLGLPVFPCGADKKPVIAAGFKSATRDALAIREAFNRPGAALIGVPTGTPSGLVVIDVDIKPGRSGMEWLDDNREALPETRTHKTRSGGLHLLFQRPTDVQIRNSAGRIAPGVDVRGEGGYVIFPPSPGYSMADPAEPAEMPVWLIRACMPAQPEPASQTAPRRPDGIDPYAQAALDGEVQTVRTAAEGQRNDRLNIAAVRLGGLIGAGALDRRLVEGELSAAAAQAGLSSKEITATLKSGLDHGVSHPRKLPERQAKTNGKHHPAAQPQPDIRPDIPPDIQPDTSAQGIEIIYFEDIEPSLNVADFVEGVLIAGEMSVIYGEPGAGKTFFATDLALHVAAGWEWHGREVAHGGVIYCALEGAHGLRNRVAAFKQKHGIEQGVAFGMVSTGLDLLDPEADVEHLITAIKRATVRLSLPVSLIVIDTLARAMGGGNENGPEDMGALIRNGDRLRDATKAHVCWVHHTGKDTARGARGHNSLLGAIDTEIEVVDQGDGARCATITKQRNLETAGAFAFTFETVQLGENARNKPVTSLVVVPDLAAPRTFHVKPTGDHKRAFEVLCDILAQSGKSGFANTPPSVLSVPEEWWRDGFYAKAKPGATQAAKQKAFRRSADWLIENRLIGMAANRVWVVSRRQDIGREDDDARRSPDI